MPGVLKCLLAGQKRRRVSQPSILTGALPLFKALIPAPIYTPIHIPIFCRLISNPSKDFWICVQYSIVHTSISPHQFGLLFGIGFLNNTAVFIALTLPHVDPDQQSVVESIHKSALNHPAFLPTNQSLLETKTVAKLNTQKPLFSHQATFAGTRRLSTPNHLNQTNHHILRAKTKYPGLPYISICESPFSFSFWKSFRNTTCTRVFMVVWARQYDTMGHIKIAAGVIVM